MASVTNTAVASTPSQPKVNIVGAIERFQTYVSSLTLSATDVVLFTDLKLPHGANVTDVRLLGKTVDGTQLFQIGTNYSGQGAAFGSATISVTQAMKTQITGLPYRVSVSDDFQPRYVSMTLTCDGAQTSSTGSCSVTLFVRYVMDP